LQINKAFRIPMHHLVAAFGDAAATVISRGVLDGKRSCVPQALMMAAGFSPAQRANTESRTMLAWPILPVLLRQCALVLVQPPDGCNLAGPSTPQPPSTVEPREGAPVCGVLRALLEPRTYPSVAASLCPLAKQRTLPGRTTRHREPDEWMDSAVQRAARPGQWR